MIKQIAQWVVSFAPKEWQALQLASLQLWQWVDLLIIILLAWGVGTVGARLALRMGGGFAKKTELESDDKLFQELRAPAILSIGLVLTWLGLHQLGLGDAAHEGLSTLLAILLTISLAWCLIRVVHFIGAAIEERASKRAARVGDYLRLRGLRTQVSVLRRVAKIVIGIITAAVILLQFSIVRTVGLSLLASAGVAGIVIGLAAQRSIATLLAGIQLSVTQPVRIGDIVIVENEWGTIEEINLTYVVIQIWDQRRLIVPMNHFLEKPFQNWTKSSAELLGPVIIYADYALPLDEARIELARIVSTMEDWDQRLATVQLVGVRELVLEVRCLVSAADSSRLWNLRCAVREGMIAWLQSHEGGKYLPRQRLTLPESTASL